MFGLCWALREKTNLCLSSWKWWKWLPPIKALTPPSTTTISIQLAFQNKFISCPFVGATPSRISMQLNGAMEHNVLFVLGVKHGRECNIMQTDQLGERFGRVDFHRKRLDLLNRPTREQSTFHWFILQLIYNFHQNSIYFKFWNKWYPAMLELKVYPSPPKKNMKQTEQNYKCSKKKSARKTLPKYY